MSPKHVPAETVLNSLMKLHPSIRPDDVKHQANHPIWEGGVVVATKETPIGSADLVAFTNVVPGFMFDLGWEETQPRLSSTHQKNNTHTISLRFRAKDDRQKA